MATLALSPQQIQYLSFGQESGGVLQQVSVLSFDTIGAFLIPMLKSSFI
jgi:hypothetical protein